MLRGAKILCIASIDWAFNWQLHQEVASAFAASGNEVLFVENIGVRRPSLKDAARIRARWTNWRRARRDRGIKPAADRLDVLSPLLVPLPYSRVARFINTRLFLRAVRPWVASHGGGPLILVTFLPSPLVLDVIRELDPALVVYYMTDRLSESSPGARRLRAPERVLLGVADLVLATSSGLKVMARELASNVELLPCGVRAGEFARARESSDPAPAVFRDLTRPVAGFIGSLRNELDLALLTELVDLVPEMNFVFAGPIQADITQMAARPNVRFLGPVSHPDVMRHMVHFDVGLVPYVLNVYTSDLMPVKLREYLAAGLPVVSTALPEVRRFAEEHPGVIAFANDAREFAAALRASVSTNGADTVARRMEIAREYDWSAQMARMSEWMETALAAKPLA